MPIQLSPGYSAQFAAQSVKKAAGPAISFGSMNDKKDDNTDSLDLPKKSRASLGEIGKIAMKEAFSLGGLAVDGMLSAALLGAALIPGVGFISIPAIPLVFVTGILFRSTFATLREFGLLRWMKQYPRHELLSRYSQ